MRPMTIVVVREDPAGGSDTGASDFAAGAAAAVVAGAADTVVAGAGAETVVAGTAAAGLAVVWASPADATRRSTARTAGSAERRFMAGQTIGRAPTRQASRSAA